MRMTPLSSQRRDRHCPSDPTTSHLFYLLSPPVGMERGLLGKGRQEAGMPLAPGSFLPTGAQPTRQCPWSDRGGQKLKTVPAHPHKLDSFISWKFSLSFNI